MAVPTIPRGEEHFFTTIYEGNGAGRRVGPFLPFTDTGSISNSVIFNDADNAYLSRTNDAGDRTKVTISVWVKRCALGAVQHIFDTYDGSSTNDGYIRFNADNTISTRIGSPSSHLYTTNATFEDVSKWYHIMLSVNTNDSTAADRVKLYVDGNRITSFSTQTNAGSGDNTQFNYGSATFRIGSTTSGSYDFDGYLAEFNQIDGQALLPASFGTTNTSTGRWIPKTIEPFPTTTTDIAVTVVSSGGNKYALDGVTQGTVTLIEGATYKFDQSDSSNSGHPLRFSTTSDGTHGGGSEFTSGVTTVGTPGSSGAYTQITVPTGTATLYYYCTQHSGMGGTANTQDQYGTNGFRLQFQDSSALGDDTSGNTNDFSVTNLVASDQTTDSPSQNFPTFDSNQTIDNAGGTNIFSEGNLRVDMDYGGSGNQYGMAIMNPAFGVTSGKFYWEHKLISQSHTNPSIYNLSMPGIIDINRDADLTSYIGHTSGKTTYSWYTLGGYVFVNGTYDPTQFLPGGSTLPAIGDIINFALDMDNGAWYIGVNGTYVTADGAVGDPTSGSSRTGAVIKFAPGTRKYVYGTSTQSGFNCVDEVNFGQKSFTHSIPTGYTKWTQDNVPTTDKNIPDFVWIKNRDQGSNSHGLINSSRGPSQNLFSNATSAEQDYDIRGLVKFLKGGFSCGEYQYVNGSGDRLVSWNWRANGGTTSTNTTGSITSTVQANTTAGFSIMEYTGSGSSGSIGHGLSSAPEVIWIKDRGSSTNWRCWHTGFGNITSYQKLNSDDGYGTASMWGSPTSSAIIVGGTGYEVNESGNNYLAYCWHSVPGFSKFGKYTGNNRSPNGRFVYLGFKPALLIVKGYTIGSSWLLMDSKRDPYNSSSELYLQANSTAAEAGSIAIDFLSNGFKCRDNATGLNGPYTYMYMAWAEHPLVGDGINPITAR